MSADRATSLLGEPPRDAVGVGASLVLGAGVTFAADATAAASPAKVVEAKKADTWETPVAKFVLGATFGQAGKMWSHNHSGQDFAVPTGTPVTPRTAAPWSRPAATARGDGPAYGNAIVIKHANDMYSQYAHLSRIDVQDRPES